MSMLKKKSGVELRSYIARKGLFTRIPVSDKLKEFEPEITLGRSVLDRALLDCVDDITISAWFSCDNERFLDICFISFLDPEDVIDKFEKTLIRLQKKEFIQTIIKEVRE